MNEFLSVIFRDLKGFIEVRAIKAGSSFVSQSFCSSVESAVEVALSLRDRHDVYVGVLPRVNRAGKAEDIEPTTPVLWMDLDPKNRTKEESFRQLARISPPPQIIVDSGSGYHAYWILKQQYPWDEAERIMRGMADAYAGDRVYDRARILRLPGTLNYKTDPPKPVRLLRLDVLRPAYSLSDFADYVEDYSASVAPSWKEVFGEQQRARSESNGMPEWLLQLIGSDPGKGLRSEHVFRVVASLVELGWTDDQIEEIIREHPDGVGAKYVEKGASAHRYLTYPIAEARRRANG